MESQIYKEIDFFFWQSRNLSSNFFFKMESMATYFFVHRLVYTHCIKVHKLVCHNLNYRCMAPFLCPGSSPNVWLVLSDGCWRGRATSMMVSSKAAVQAVLGCMRAVGWMYLPQCLCLTGKSLAGGETGRCMVAESCRLLLG